MYYIECKTFTFKKSFCKIFLHHIFVIVCFLGMATPLTNPLTASQAAAKEIQKQDLVTLTAGQSK
jgi:hypothetical protein